MKRSPTGFVHGLPIAAKQTGAYGPNPTAYQQRMRDLLDQGPAVELPTLPQIAPTRVVIHSDSCICDDCLTAAQHRADYEKARKLFNDNNF